VGGCKTHVLIGCSIGTGPHTCTRGGGGGGNKASSSKDLTCLPSCLPSCRRPCQRQPFCKPTSHVRSRWLPFSLEPSQGPARAPRTLHTPDHPTRVSGASKRRKQSSHGPERAIEDISNHSPLVGSLVSSGGSSLGLLCEPHVSTLTRSVSVGVEQNTGRGPAQRAERSTPAIDRRSILPRRPSQDCISSRRAWHSTHSFRALFESFLAVVQECRMQPSGAQTRIGGRWLESTCITHDSLGAGGGADLVLRAFWYTPWMTPPIVEALKSSDAAAEHTWWNPIEWVGYG
jgi:hypothetical protein